MPEISIVDTRNMIRAVKHKYDTDLSFFSLTPLRYKLDRIIRAHYLKFPDILVSRLLEDKGFFEEFMHEILNTQPELFRDPELWINFKDTILHQLNGLFGQFNIWLQGCSGCNELYSLIILLTECGFRKKSNIFISYNSEYTQSAIFNINSSYKSSDINMDNLNKVFPEIDKKKYFEQEEDKYKIKKSILDNILNFKQENIFQSPNKTFNLILFRNKLINYSLTAQNQIIKNLSASLEKNGILVLGYRENISNFLNSSEDISALYADENIFKKN